ncbi:MAG: hypothetical protein ACPGQS_03130 [Bradymonadia bacterium]
MLRFSLFCVGVFLPIWSVCAQPQGGSLKDRLRHPETRSAFLSDHLIVDGSVDPRFWFGCCKAEQQCRLPESKDRLHCHRFSDVIGAERFASLTGAKLGFRRFDSARMSTQRKPLTDALTDSNQLDALIKSQGARFLYVAEVDLNALKQPSMIARWSKNIHLAGVRGIRLTSSDNITVSETDLVLIHRSLSMLFGRYFLMDVGGLNDAHLSLLLDYAEPRNLPLLATGVHLGSAGRCAPHGGTKSMSISMMCRLIASGGVLVLGAVSTQETNRWMGCSEGDLRNDYLRKQLMRARQLSCKDGGNGHLPIESIALGSYSPIVRAPKADAQIIDAHWHRFAGGLLETNMPVKEVLDVLGASTVRLLRRALPGVQPPKLLFPKDAQRLSGDRGIQFQWVSPVKNEPKRMSGRIFGMRGGRILIEKEIGRHYQPWRTERVISGDKKIIILKPGQYRWRLTSSNRKTSVSSMWGYFEVTPHVMPTKEGTNN